MIRLEDIATAVLARDAMRVRGLLQEFLRAEPDFAAYPQPTSVDARTMTMTAGILELLATRAGACAPAWVSTAGTFPDPFFVPTRALSTPSIRDACRRESPEPLSRRNIFAPAQYLTAV